MKGVTSFDFRSRVFLPATFLPTVHWYTNIFELAAQNTIKVWYSAQTSQPRTNNEMTKSCTRVLFQPLIARLPFKSSRRFIRCKRCKRTRKPHLDFEVSISTKRSTRFSAPRQLFVRDNFQFQSSGPGKYPYRIMASAIRFPKFCAHQAKFSKNARLLFVLRDT